MSVADPTTPKPCFISLNKIIKLGYKTNFKKKPTKILEVIYN